MRGYLFRPCGGDRQRGQPSRGDMGRGWLHCVALRNFTKDSGNFKKHNERALIGGEAIKKYECLYADPPYSYRVWGKKGSGRTAENHYPTMRLQDICALPVAGIAADNSILFLWATYPQLQEAMKIIEAWSFEYRTVAFTWVKRNKKSDGWFVGLGHYTRANAEVCLLATRGRPRRVSKSVRQVIDAPIERHSKKPDEARKRIVELMGDVPRIELFAREKADGWDVFGNEVESDILLCRENLYED
jgi:N6-adenosine-specific RNA methylase IME4